MRLGLGEASFGFAARDRAWLGSRSKNAKPATPSDCWRQSALPLHWQHCSSLFHIIIILRAFVFASICGRGIGCACADPGFTFIEADDKVSYLDDELNYSVAG